MTSLLRAVCLFVGPFVRTQGGQEIDTMSGADANLLEQTVAKLAEA